MALPETNFLQLTSVMHSTDIHDVLGEINGRERYEQYRAEWEKASRGLTC